MNYLKTVPLSLFIVTATLLSSGCAKKNYDVKLGEKIVYPTGDGVMLGACEKWTLKPDKVKQLISQSKPYAALPYGEYSQTPCNMSGTVTIDGKTWDYLLNGGGIITLSIDGMVRYRGCNSDACKPYLLVPYRGQSYAVRDTDTLVSDEEESTAPGRGRLLSAQSIPQNNNVSDASGSPMNSNHSPENGPLIAGKTPAVQGMPGEGQRRRPDVDAVQAQGNGQKAPLGQNPVSANAPVYTRNETVQVKGVNVSAQVPSVQNPVSGRVPSVPSAPSMPDARSAMPSVNVSQPTISRPEVGISVPTTSAPSIDIKPPTISVPGAEISVPGVPNIF